MEKLNPSKILQMHGIEAFDDPRSSEQIVQDFIDKGVIKLVIDSSIEEINEVQ
jgi:hypothetical protein